MWCIAIWNFADSSGNFKMNGSLSSVEQIVKQLNDAKLDGKNGMSSVMIEMDVC